MTSESAFSSEKFLQATHKCQSFLNGATADDLLGLCTYNSTGDQGLSRSTFSFSETGLEMITH